MITSIYPDEEQRCEKCIFTVIDTSRMEIIERREERRSTEISEHDNRIGHNGKRGKRRLRYTTKRIIIIIS